MKIEGNSSQWAQILLFLVCIRVKASAGQVQCLLSGHTGGNHRSFGSRINVSEPSLEYEGRKNNDDRKCNVTTKHEIRSH